MSNIDDLARLLKKVAPNEATEILSLTKQLRDDLVKANRRAMTVRKELSLPTGTIVISPDSGTWGVIGTDGMIDRKSVKPLDPHAFDAVGGVFYTPSKRPVGSDGSGQSLIGPGFINEDGSVVGKSGRGGLAVAVADAQRRIQGAGSLRATLVEAQQGLPNTYGETLAVTQ